MIAVVFAGASSSCHQQPVNNIAKVVALSPHCSRCRFSANVRNKVARKKLLCVGYAVCLCGLLGHLSSFSYKIPSSISSRDGSRLFKRGAERLYHFIVFIIIPNNMREHLLVCLKTQGAENNHGWNVLSNVRNYIPNLAACLTTSGDHLFVCLPIHYAAHTRERTVRVFHLRSHLCHPLEL